MKAPSKIYKWCCPRCDSEEDFEWVGETHLECQDCLRVGVEEMFVECPDYVDFSNAKRGAVIKK